MLSGTSLLSGDSTVPGVQISKELLEAIPDILRMCKDFGLDFRPTVVEFLRYDEISEIASYGGFPVRYPHWRWGMEYEDLAKGYEYGMHKIYEMIVNTDPCYIYCLDSNTYVDHVTVIAHATGHNDFFKNNVFFGSTSQNMMNELANHGTRIRRYMTTWGREVVGQFIDRCLQIDTLIDSSKAWEKKKYQEPIMRDKRQYFYPRRLKVERDHMEEWIHPPEWVEKEKEEVIRKETKNNLAIFESPEKDIMGYLKNHAPLKPWQADILGMLYEEAMYFAPQRQTKIINEGWASFVDFSIMARAGLAGDGGVIDYSDHKSGVLGGKYSSNPYKLGFLLFLDIEDRWNKGRFGKAYDECTNIKEKEDWDHKLGLGHEKVFEVRELYNDITMIAEFFTQEFCDKYEFFKWALMPNGEYQIETRNANEIRNILIKQYLNGGLPIIRLDDPNYRGKKHFLLQHVWEGRILHVGYTKHTLASIYCIWQNPVILASRDKDENEIVFVCNSEDPEEVKVVSREKYEA